MPELLFEIGCEEMPARFVVPAMTDLAALASQMLGKEGLLPEGSTPDQVRTAGTPRRLVLMAQGLAERQPDRQETALGPPLKAAYDKDGQPTKAALGFAKSQGVEVDQLSQAETEKGPRLAYVKHLPGQPAAQVLAELLPRLAQALHFAKTMRWGELEFRFARPIHWLLALLDGQVIPFELAGIQSGGLTRGHRFMSPDPIQVSGVDDYLAQLEAASVIVDRAQRRHLTAMEVETTAQVAQGRLVDDPALLEEVTDLVELPVACCGTFDQEFLEVPRAVIISAMRGHQRYFALEDSAGNLLPNFIAVNNTKPRDLAVVTRGHEKVLRARLSDARFFLTEDTKEPLATRLQELERVTYHAKLGASRQKVERFSALAGWLAQQLAPELKDMVLRAAALAKCDLVTEMVGEFPDLQGVVGEEYARRDGEDPQVAVAIREHYMPVGAEAPLPQGMVGTLVGIADRLDTICGFFGINQPPSGAADPYALRRAAIAVIRLVLEKNLPLSLDQTLDQALAGLAPWLKEDPAQVKEQVLHFLAVRLTGMLAEQGVPADVAEAVLAVGFDDLCAAKARALALAQVKESPDFLPLAIGMKRVMNILRKEAEQVPSTPPDPALMKEAAESELHQAFVQLEAQARARFAEGDYQAFLQGVSALRAPIDKFFDDVLVMAPEEDLRKNRLALLAEIAGLFAQVAQFTHLQLG